MAVIHLPELYLLLKCVWIVLTLTLSVLFIPLHYLKYALLLDCNHAHFTKRAEEILESNECTVRFLGVQAVT